MFGPGGPSLRELLAQALSSTDRGYDLLAPKFEHTPFCTPRPVLDAAQVILAAGGTVPRALDLCCGTGAGLRMLGPLADEVWGLDRSGGMLTEAAQSVRGSEVPVHVVRGDALAPPLRPGQFDLVTCFGAFGHILESDEPALVAAVHALLRPGGRFAFVTAPAPRKLHPGYAVAKAFNAAMRVRNALHSPPFVMYYLTFLLPRATALLEAQGFEVQAHTRLAPAPFSRLVWVVATRR